MKFLRPTVCISQWQFGCGGCAHCPSRPRVSPALFPFSARAPAAHKAASLPADRTMGAELCSFYHGRGGRGGRPIVMRGDAHRGARRDRSRDHYHATPAPECRWLASTDEPAIASCFRHTAPAERAATMPRRADGGAGGAGRRAPGLFQEAGRTRARLQQVPRQDGQEHTAQAQGAKAKVCYIFHFSTSWRD